MLRWATAAVLLLLVALPRFDMRDPGSIGKMTAGAKETPWGHPLDVEGYARLVGWFRGTAPTDSMIPPFCYRPLAPALAAPFPARPVTAINLVNLAALLSTLALLQAIGATIGLGARARWAAMLLFAVSFPAFYYGAIGFIDPVAILFASALLLATLRGAPLVLLVPLAGFATLAKETNAVFALLPLIGALRARGRGAGALARAAAPFAAAFATHLAVRSALPFPEPDAFWIPSLKATVENLSRPRTYASLLLTIALPAGLAAAALLSGGVRGRIGREHRVTLVAGALLAAGLYAYSIATAHTDGRIVWVAYPFLLPIAAAWFERRRHRDPTARGAA
ncbi:MAG TPA: hypothetical protein VLT84_01815 [Acidobacteriota bacterium]|nr:hypothetical protein [Acidobacteriota bacterium]